MLDRYSDYFVLAKTYLRNYTDFLLARDELQKQKDIKKQEYQAIKTPIAKYSTEPGGENELTSTEQGADRRIKLREEYLDIGRDVYALTLKISQIDYALESIEERNAKALRLKFFNKFNDEEIAAEIGLAESYVMKFITKSSWLFCNKLFEFKLSARKKYKFVFLD